MMDWIEEDSRTSIGLEESCERSRAPQLLLVLNSYSDQRRPTT